MHGMQPSGVDDPQVAGHPAVGTDPTQGAGTEAWQRALRMGLQVNARQRRN